MGVRAMRETIFPPLNVSFSDILLGLAILWLIYDGTRKNRAKFLIDAADLLAELVSLGMDRVRYEEVNGVWGLTFLVRELQASTDNDRVFTYRFVSMEDSNIRDDLRMRLARFKFKDLRDAALHIVKFLPRTYEFSESENTDEWSLKYRGDTS